MNKEIIEKIFPGTTDLIMKGLCPHCKKPITEFRNSLSEKEFTISGLCQKCQDSIFGKD